MQITLKEIYIRDLVEGYADNQEEGVFGFGGRLNIRPAYQREFIYKEKQRNAVIETVRKDFPLNVMYWIDNEDGTYEVLDGQQRTISICQYVTGVYSVNFQYFHNLEEDEKEQILNYKLMVYFCSGSDREKLDWFKTINISGEKLTDQELRNAIYTGPWLESAKKYFSKTGCPAHAIGDKYLKGSSIRQEYLETVIDWVSDGHVEDYMAEHQHDSNATDLWIYFQTVIIWIQSLFPDYKKEMKGLDLGRLYNEYKENKYDIKAFKSRIEDLMADDDVTKKSGVYEYVLSGETKEKCLSIRTFTDSQKRTVYTQQNGVCPHCGQKFDIKDMEGDHITPWHEGGKTVIENLQMLCKNCNRTKGGR